MPAPSAQVFRGHLHSRVGRASCPPRARSASPSCRTSSSVNDPAAAAAVAAGCPPWRPVEGGRGRGLGAHPERTPCPPFWPAEGRRRGAGRCTASGPAVGRSMTLPGRPPGRCDGRFVVRECAFVCVGCRREVFYRVQSELPMRAKSVDTSSTLTLTIQSVPVRRAAPSRVLGSVVCGIAKSPPACTTPDRADVTTLECDLSATSGGFLDCPTTA